MSAKPEYVLKLKIDDALLNKQIKKLNQAIKVNVSEGLRASGGAAKAAKMEEIRMTAREIKNALKGVVSTGSRAKKVLPGSLGIEGRPDDKESTPIGVKYGDQSSWFKKFFERFKVSSKEVNKFTFGDNFAKLMKVGIITAALGGILMAVKGLAKASPLLESMLQVFEMAMTLFFRPFGDMIAMFLKPFVIMMLKFAIPWYKWASKNLVQPVANWAKVVEQGGALKMWLDSPEGQKAQKDFVNNINTFTQMIKDANSSIYNAFVSLKEKIQTTISGLFSNLSADNLRKGLEEIVGFFSTVSKQVGSILWRAWTETVLWFGNVGISIRSTLTAAWNWMTNFFMSLQNIIKGVLIGAWDKVMMFFYNAKQTIQNVLEGAWKKITEFFNTIKSTLEKVASALKSAYDKVKNMLKSIGLGGLFGGGKAEGGAINERIKGIGMLTGRSYEFGERGQEYVMNARQMAAMRGGGGTYNITVPITIAGGTGNMNAAELKRIIEPIVLEAVQKATQRRGIL